jgi:hypothetical protein
MEQPTSSKVTPEQIYTYGLQKRRPLVLDKTVVAAFGSFFRLGIPSRS